MEYVNGTSIDKYTHFLDNEWNNVFLQVINAFKYLEEKEILHRDIRPQNILIDKMGIVKIIDFGFGKIIDKDEKDSNSVMLNWPVSRLPEEVYIEEKYNVNYWDIEEENIEIEKIDVMGIDIIKSESDSILVACDIGIVLEGKFSCLDYDNSYYSSEEEEYLYKQYINRDELMYVCDTIIEIKKDNDKFNQLTIKDFPEIEIDYNTMAGIEAIY